MFKINTINLEKFVNRIKELEKIPEVIQETNYNDFPFNANKMKKPIFALKIMEEKNNVIPFGNYYIEFYYYFKNNGILKKEIVGMTDLLWNINSKRLEVPGIHPLFLIGKQAEMTMNTGNKELILYTIEMMSLSVVIDRLKQICSKKTALPDSSLLSSSLNSIFKFSDTILPNKQNALKKIVNKVIFVSKNPQIEGGSWAFQKFKNPKGTFSDAFTKKNPIDLELLENIVDHYDLILGESSEEGAQKGSIVVLNEELQKLRGNTVTKSYYEDTAYGPALNGMGVYSIFNQQKKIFARVKSFVTSDSSVVINPFEIKKAENEESVFERSIIYMSSEQERIGKRDNRVLNMLSVFPITEEYPEELNVENFEDLDKNEYSKYLHLSDCNMPINKESSNILVKIARTIEEPITVLHLDLNFKSELERLREGKVLNFSADTIIGYKVTCPNECCRSIMRPIKQLGAASPEGDFEYEEINASKTKSLWYCDVCGEQTTTIPENITIQKKYPNAKSFELNDYIINQGEAIIKLIVDIVTPINISRVVTIEGGKALTVPQGKDFMGYITGEYYDSTDDSYKEIPYMNVDLVCPLGAIKSKISGIGLSHLRLINALNGTKYSIDEYFKANKLKDINSLLKKCKKVKWTRRCWNSKTNTFDFKTSEVYVGLLSLNVTEVGDEFLKVKPETDPMKISYMNNLFYNWLGFEELNKTMIKNSLYNFNDKENKEFIIELLKILYQDPTGLPEVSEKDFDNKGIRATIVSWMDKKEWNTILEKHPLFMEGGKFENGAYYKDSKEGIVVFPSRKTIIRLTDIVNSEKVRVHTIVKQALSLFLNIYMKTRNPNKNLGSAYRIYTKSIYDKLTGKQGLFSKSSTFVNVGTQGKECGCGYLPTGVVVIGNKKFWKMAKRNFPKLGLDYNKVITGDHIFYGTSQRDPFIWIFQALNSVEIWPVERANTYFLKEYGIKFSKMYPDFNGIALNTLDMLYLYQTDADGDLRRILTPFNIEIQQELRKMNLAMKNYNLICKNEENTIKKIYDKVKKWHLDYVLKEQATACTPIDDTMKIKLKTYLNKDKNKSIIKGIRGKGNIGIITTSQWKIQEICDFFVKNKLPLKINDDLVYLSEEDRNIISVFYQTVFTQEGCVRALKGDKDLSKCSIDEIAYNRNISWIDASLVKKEGTIRDMVKEEAENFGFLDIIDKFFAICDWWKEVAKIQLVENKVISKVDEQLEEAEVINAYVSICNGSKFSSYSKLDLFKKLVAPNTEKLYGRELLGDIGKFLNDLVKKEEK